MTDRYVHLIGVEEVARAGSTMAQAATDMNRAAANIEGALQRHQSFLEDWLQRFEAMLQARVIPFRSNKPDNLA